MEPSRVYESKRSASKYGAESWRATRVPRFRRLAAAVLAVQPALSGGPIGLNRYRQPMMPFVCVLAGAGWRRPTRPG